MEAQLFIFAAVAISEVVSLCGPSQARLINFQQAPKRSISYNVGMISKKCAGLNEFYYKWTLLEIPGDTILYESDDETININGYNFDSKTCFDKEYKIIGKVSHYPDMSSAAEAEGIFHFVPDQMHIEILGGLERTHLQDEDLIVDAKELSTDPSYSPEENPFEGNIIEWKIRPSFDDYEPPAELVLKIPSSLLTEGTYYSFSVTVQRTKIKNHRDEKSATQIVEVISGKSPNLQIKCTRNCVFPNTMEPTTFVTECIKNCVNLSYVWSLHPVPAANKTAFGTGYDKLVLYEKAYSPGQIFTLSVKSGSAYFKKTIKFASGLKRGTCEFTPLEGLNLVTEYSIACKGFFSPYGINTYLVQQYFENQKVILQTFTSQHDIFDIALQNIHLAFGLPAKVSITVQDSAFLQDEIEFSITVGEYFSGDDKSLPSILKSLVLAEYENSITSLSLEGFTNKVVQMVSSIVDTINKFSVEKTIARDLHKHMAEAILRFNPVTYTRVLQVFSILTRLMEFRFDEDTITSELIAKTMLKNVIGFHQLYAHTPTGRIPKSYVQSVFGQTLTITSNLLKINRQIQDVLERQHPPHDYDSYDQFSSEKSQIRDDFRSILSTVIVALQTNSLTAVFKNVPNEKSDTFESDMLGIRVRRQLFMPEEYSTFMEIGKEGEHPTIFLPKSLLYDLQKTSEYADFEFGVFKESPIWWHTDASTFTADFILFDIFINCRRIKTVKYPFLIDLDFHEFPHNNISGTLTETSTVAYRMELESNRVLEMEFKGHTNNHKPFKATWSDCFCKDEDFSSPRAIEITGQNNQSSFMTVRNGKDLKIIYICVKKSSSKLTYTIKLASLSCLSWDVRAKEFSGEGCRVKETKVFTPKPHIICECNHFSLFTVQVVVPFTSLTINSDTDFTIDSVKNYLMVEIVLGLLTLWLFFLLLAHRKDKAAQKKNVIYKLDDNVPGDSHPYLVVVFTGIFFDAHTTADVAIQLVGKRARSRVHVLRCRNVTFLKRNSQDWFMLFSPLHLGELKKIKLWHNSKGQYPHWYCERVIVQDLKTSEQYCFIVQKWFSLIWGSGKYVRTVNAREPRHQNAKLLFETHLEKSFRDNHIWMSILTRDLQSNFNSKERVSVGFCFLFLSMLANALLYGIPNGTPQDSIDEQSSFYISAANVIIFVLSWLVATPMGLFIIFIFKNSAPL